MINDLLAYGDVDMIEMEIMNFLKSKRCENAMRSGGINPNLIKIQYEEKYDTSKSRRGRVTNVYAGRLIKIYPFRTETLQIRIYISNDKYPELGNKHLVTISSYNMDRPLKYYDPKHVYPKDGSFFDVFQTTVLADVKTSICSHFREFLEKDKAGFVYSKLAKARAEQSSQYSANSRARG